MRSALQCLLDAHLSSTTELITDNSSDSSRIAQYVHPGNASTGVLWKYSSQVAAVPFRSHSTRQRFFKRRNTARNMQPAWRTRVGMATLKYVQMQNQDVDVLVEPLTQKHVRSNTGYLGFNR